MFYFDDKTFIPTIEFNSNDAVTRNRFTIAHELGHYVLGHNNVYRDTSLSWIDYTGREEEISANNFAAELLMPEEQIRFYMDQVVITDLNKLARIFMVSLEALLIRLKRLGYGK